MVTQSGGLERIYLDQPWSELKDSYKRQIQSALKTVLPGVDKTPERVKVSYEKSQSEPKGALGLYVRLDNDIIILRDGQVIRSIKLIKNEEIDEGVLKAAEGVFVGLEGIKQGTLVEPTQLLTENGKTVYTLVFGTGPNPVFVNVEKGTNKVTKVSAHELQDSPANYKEAFKKMKSYSEDQFAEKCSQTVQGAFEG